MSARDVRGQRFVFFDQFRSLPRVSDRSWQFSPTYFRSLPAVFSQVISISSNNFDRFWSTSLLIASDRFRQFFCERLQSLPPRATLHFDFASFFPVLLPCFALAPSHFHHAKEANCQEIHWWSSQEKAPRSIDTGSPI